MTQKEQGPLNLVTEVGAAAMLDVSRATLADWRRRGVGPPHIRIGRTVRYRFGDIIEFVSERRKQ